MRPIRALAVTVLLACGVATASSAPHMRSGGEIMQRFHAGLADADCRKPSTRWRTHYARAADHLADKDEVALAVFGYVLDEVREAGLPSEFGLIPFVESRYHADARSHRGPAGLWQFTAATARRHGMRVQGQVDERLSVVASTEAAVRYLSRLHRMFGRDWRQTVMAYNAGEGAVQKYGNQIPPYRETQNYVVKVLNYYQQYRGNSFYNTASYGGGSTPGPLAYSAYNNGYTYYSSGYGGSGAGYGNRGSGGVTVITPRGGRASASTGSATIPRTYLTPTGTRIVVGASGAANISRSRPPVVYSAEPNRVPAPSNRTPLFAGNDK